MHAHEITHLPAVFKNQGSAPVQQTRGEDGGDSRVRIRERLPFTVDVEIAQCDNWHVIRTAEKQAHLFLVFLGKGIDGGALQRLGLVGSTRREYLSADGASCLPSLTLQLFWGPRWRGNIAALDAHVLP